MSVRSTICWLFFNCSRFRHDSANDGVSSPSRSSNGDRNRKDAVEDVGEDAQQLLVVRYGGPHPLGLGGIELQEEVPGSPRD
jgi:hypothetical protein